MTARLDRYTTYVVLVGFSLLAIYPMLSILFLAFHKKTDLVTGFSLPTTFSLQTFIDAWNEGGFAQGMWGSFLVATTVTIVSAVLSLFTGYAFGTMRFRGSGVLFYLIVVGLIFPYEATVIPLYYDFLNYHPAGINLAGSYWALILPQIGQSVTLGTFWMRAFFLSTPQGTRRGGPDRRSGLVPRSCAASCCRRRGPRCSRSACSCSSTPGTSSCSRSCC